MNIAIDGPAAAGKSSIAKAIARSLNMTYLDTGAMYRAIAYCALENNISLEDEQSLVSFIQNNALAFFLNEQGEQRLFINQDDVTDLIRNDKISHAASTVSTKPLVRVELVSLQRKMASESDTGVVMDGRDIGTVVLPQADYKFFVFADPTERAKRRMNDWDKRNIAYSQTLEEVAASIAERDELDATRAASPLCAAPDAQMVDTTDMTLEESIQSILNQIHQ